MFNFTQSLKTLAKPYFYGDIDRQNYTKFSYQKGKDHRMYKVLKVKTNNIYWYMKLQKNNKETKALHHGDEFEINTLYVLAHGSVIFVHIIFTCFIFSRNKLFNLAKRNHSHGYFSRDWWQEWNPSVVKCSEGMHLKQLLTKCPTPGFPRVELISLMHYREKELMAGFWHLKIREWAYAGFLAPQNQIICDKWSSSTLVVHLLEWIVIQTIHLYAIW